MPAHRDIEDDLKLKKRHNPSSFKKLYTAIQQVYELQEPDKVISSLRMRFSVGHPVDLVLKVIKWFFIEQDITYWNYSGRDMFMGGVEDIVPRK